MSMYAILDKEYPPDLHLNLGDRIEVIGFVVIGFEVHAVYRDEHGWVWTIPVSFIRMVPFVPVPGEVADATVKVEA